MGLLLDNALLVRVVLSSFALMLGYTQPRQGWWLCLSPKGVFCGAGECHQPARAPKSSKNACEKAKVVS